MVKKKTELYSLLLINILIDRVKYSRKIKGNYRRNIKLNLPYHLFTIFSTYQQHFYSFENSPFYKTIIHRIAIQMYKHNKTIIPKTLTELFTLNSSNQSYNTRNKDKIRSAYGKHKFMYQNFRFTCVHI